ncbi:mitochondrial carrier [Microthyrium microscopicum]|uniref:Mitochondrial carrier n=1 Tax=Microthyrium microscopicum TaxID=703497 RepID=A0A6A6U101_9PEZI|nr:mitochondrial carrier [Microthyrium microscopicum]
MSADFWAGCISGAAGIIVGNPLDLIKTRLQAGNELHPTSAASLRSTFENASTLVRGATAPVIGYGALNALLFVTYNRSLSFLSSYSGTPSYPQMYLAGVVGGLATFVVSAPTELIKVRAQLENTGAGSSNTRLSSLSIAKQTWKREGLRGIYLGGGITAIRDSVGYGFYFCSYDFAKKLLASPSDPNTQNLRAWQILLCGGIAGCISWASIFPMDVIKTRIQSQPLLSAKLQTTTAASPLSPTAGSLLPRSPQGVSYGTTSGQTSPSSSISQSLTPTVRKSTLAVTMDTYKTEGLSVFFRGLGICSVRAFIVNAVQWAVYEWVMTVLQPKNPGLNVLNEKILA